MRWVQAWRASGCVAAQRQGGDRRSRRIEAYHEVIFAAIEAKVDITLIELSDLLRTHHGVRFAPSSVWRFLDRHGMTFKKNGARRRAGTARRRGQARGLAPGTA